MTNACAYTDEEIISKFNKNKSFCRRFAKLEEVKAIWKPSKNKIKNQYNIKHDTKNMTWKNFLKLALPIAEEIQVYISNYDQYGAIVTSVSPYSQPILKWDSEDNRNPFSWYTYDKKSRSDSWNLPINEWVDVTGICYQPSMWKWKNDHNYGEAVFFLLEECKDKNYQNCGLGLFPDILKSNFKKIKPMIYAYSKSKCLENFLGATACGLRLEKNKQWNTKIKVKYKNTIQNVILNNWK